MPHLRQLVSSSLLFVALFACASPKSAREASAPRETLQDAAWTRTFEERAVLAAREIEVVGPKGLLEHLAITRDPENHSHDEKVSSEGLRIVERQLEHGDGTPIRAQLDNLVLSADVQLLVLESPGAAQVEVRASGDVYFHVLATGEERRGASLRLVGAP